MRSSIRPWVTTGIAVVGAGVIAVAPFEPLPPPGDFQIENSAVELNATASPFDYYPSVVLRSLDNVGDRLSEYLSAPLPIVTAVIENQYHAFADIAGAAGDRDVGAVLNAVIRAIALPVVNLVKVAQSGEPFSTAASLIIRLALPIVSAVMAAGSAVGDVVEAVIDLDVVGALSATTNIPARIIDGLLNGRVDAINDDYFGLLAPVADAPVSDQLTGPVSFLIESLQGIGDTISSPMASGAGPADDPALAVATVPPSAAPLVEPPMPPDTPGAETSAAPDGSDDPPPMPTDEPEPGDRGTEAPSNPAESAPDNVPDDVPEPTYAEPDDTEPGDASAPDEEEPAAPGAAASRADPGTGAQAHAAGSGGNGAAATGTAPAE